MERNPIIHIVKSIYEQAKSLGACDRFRGDETYRQLVELFLSEQGIEFCVKHDFPPEAVFDHFDKDKMKEDGIYYNCGKINLYNPGQVVLIGNTEATINYDIIIKDCRVILLQGAKATVNATNGAVAFTRVSRSCSVERTRNNMGIVI